MDSQKIKKGINAFKRNKNRIDKWKFPRNQQFRLIPF